VSALRGRLQPRLCGPPRSLLCVRGVIGTLLTIS
jgi:hypothetical protein